MYLPSQKVVIWKRQFEQTKVKKASLCILRTEYMKRRLGTLHVTEIRKKALKKGHFHNYVDGR